MASTSAREVIHELVDELPESELPRVRRVLEEIRDNGASLPTDRSDEPSAYEKAEAAGLVGCVEGPPDLSTNPDDMADFGR